MLQDTYVGRSGTVYRIAEQQRRVRGSATYLADGLVIENDEDAPYIPFGERMERRLLLEVVSLPASPAQEPSPASPAQEPSPVSPQQAAQAMSDSLFGNGQWNAEFKLALADIMVRRAIS